MKIIEKFGFQIALLFSVLVLLTGVLGYFGATEGYEEYALVDFPLSITYVMVFVGVVLSIGLPLFKAMKDPKSLKYTGIFVGVLALLLVVTYINANGAVPADNPDTYEGITSSNLKLAGSLLSTAVVLFCLGLGGLIALEVKSLIKK